MKVAQRRRKDGCDKGVRHTVFQACDLVLRCTPQLKGTVSPKHMDQLLKSKRENFRLNFFKFAVPISKWLRLVATVTVDNVELGEEKAI